MVGKELYEAFKSDSALGLRAMFWWFDEAHEDWRLYVVSKFCDDHGRKATYLRLRRSLDKNGLSDYLPLYRIVAARTNSPVVKSVKNGRGAFYRYDKAGDAKGLRVVGSTIEDAPATRSTTPLDDVQFTDRAFK